MTPRKPTKVFGIDIGGTGIKGAIVDLKTGELAAERYRIDTPQPATPQAVVKVCGEVASHFAFAGPVGVTYPGVVQHGIVHTAANMDPSWIGTNLVEAVSAVVPGDVTGLNDADAAGLAEVHYGVGQGVRGLVIMVTFGTGIGIALLHNGLLIPNAELGHIEIDGHDAESRAAASVKDRKGLSWDEWAERASKYLITLEKLLWPELIIVGGGVSKKAEKWVPQLNTRTPIKVAEMLNNAGIVGAALAAVEDVEGP